MWSFIGCGPPIGILGIVACAAASAESCGNTDGGCCKFRCSLYNLAQVHTLPNSSGVDRPIFDGAFSR
jgi:hypothetical protein